KYGAGYAPIAIVLLLGFAILTTQTWIQSCELSGIRRLQIRIFVLSFGTCGFVTTGLNIIGNLYHVSSLKHLGILFVLLALTLTSVSIFYYRVFNIQELLSIVYRFIV